MVGPNPVDLLGTQDLLGDLGAEHGMELDLLALIGGERSDLQKHGTGDTDLAHVVDQRRLPQQRYAIGGPSSLLGQQRGQDRDRSECRRVVGSRASMARASARRPVSA